MKRVTKQYEERLNEILLTAQQLFFEKGYEKVSVNDIISKVGVAKGTFYYYFKSKVDLLDELVVRFSDNLKDKMTKTLESKKLNAVKKINEIFEIVRETKAQKKELMVLILKMIYKEENMLFFHKMNKYTVKMAIPIYLQIIKEGIKDKLFNVKYPEEIAKQIIFFGIGIREYVSKLLIKSLDNPENLKKIEKTFKAYEDTVEKMLSAKKGTIIILKQGYIKKFLKFKTRSGGDQ